MTKKINRTLMGKEIVEKEFGDFIDNGGAIGSVAGTSNLLVDGRLIEGLGDSLALKSYNTGVLFLHHDYENDVDSFFPDNSTAFDLGTDWKRFNSLYLNGDAFIRQKVSSKTDYMELFAGASELGVVIDVNNLRLRPKTKSNMKLGDTSWRFKDVYLEGESKTGSGYCKLPNGMIMQWGVAHGKTNDFIQQNTPIAFPNKILACNATVFKNVTYDNNMHLQNLFCSCSYWGVDKVQVVFGAKATHPDTFAANWIAIGY